MEISYKGERFSCPRQQLTLSRGYIIGFQNADGRKKKFLISELELNDQKIVKSAIKTNKAEIVAKKMAAAEKKKKEIRKSKKRARATIAE